MSKFLRPKEMLEIVDYLNVRQSFGDIYQLAIDTQNGFFVTNWSKFESEGLKFGQLLPSGFSAVLPHPISWFSIMMANQQSGISWSISFPSKYSAKFDTLLKTNEIQ